MVTSTKAPSIFIHDREIGQDCACFVIAEAGVNHNGKQELAVALIDAAADAGADAVKFQTFRPDALAAPEAPKAQYQERSGPQGQTQRDMLEALMLPLEGYRELMMHARRRGLVFLSSPFDEQSADFLHELGLPAFKVGSGELTNHPLLVHVARKGVPMVVSTGMSTLEEVGDAVTAIREAAACTLALLHCVSSYPTEPSQSNLRAMRTLQEAFGVPVGWSDHTEGVEVSIAAVALGAAIIEKHLTIDKQLPGPDHHASLEPQQFSEMIRGIRLAQSALGTGEKRPTADELPVANVVRKSLFLRTPAKRGAILTPQHVVALRPGTGIPPSALSRLLGRRFRVDLNPGTVLTETDLEAD